MQDHRGEMFFLVMPKDEISPMRVLLPWTLSVVKVSPLQGRPGEPFA
jgi:hypothetical protein